MLNLTTGHGIYMVFRYGYGIYPTPWFHTSHLAWPCEIHPPQCGTNFDMPWLVVR